MTPHPELKTVEQLKQTVRSLRTHAERYANFAEMGYSTQADIADRTADKREADLLAALDELEAARKQNAALVEQIREARAVLSENRYESGGIARSAIWLAMVTLDAALSLVPSP